MLPSGSNSPDRLYLYQQGSHRSDSGGGGGNAEKDNQRLLPPTLPNCSSRVLFSTPKQQQVQPHTHGSGSGHLYAHPRGISETPNSRMVENMSSILPHPLASHLWSDSGDASTLQAQGLHTTEGDEDRLVVVDPSRSQHVSGLEGEEVGSQWLKFQAEQDVRESMKLEPPQPRLQDQPRQESSTIQGSSLFKSSALSTLLQQQQQQQQQQQLRASQLSSSRANHDISPIQCGKAPLLQTSSSLMPPPPPPPPPPSSSAAGGRAVDENLRRKNLSGGALAHCVPSAQVTTRAMASATAAAGATSSSYAQPRHHVYPASSRDGPFPPTSADARRAATSTVQLSLISGSGAAVTGFCATSASPISSTQRERLHAEQVGKAMDLLEEFRRSQSAAEGSAGAAPGVGADEQSSGVERAQDTRQQFKKLYSPTRGYNQELSSTEKRMSPCSKSGGEEVYLKSQEVQWKTDRERASRLLHYNTLARMSYLSSQADMTRATYIALMKGGDPRGFEASLQHGVRDGGECSGGSPDSLQNGGVALVRVRKWTSPNASLTPTSLRQTASSVEHEPRYPLTRSGSSVSARGRSNVNALSHHRIVEAINQRRSSNGDRSSALSQTQHSAGSDSMLLGGGVGARTATYYSALGDTATFRGTVVFADDDGDTEKEAYKEEDMGTYAAEGYPLGDYSASRLQQQQHRGLGIQSPQCQEQTTAFLRSVADPGTSTSSCLTATRAATVAKQGRTVTISGDGAAAVAGATVMTGGEEDQDHEEARRALALLSTVRVLRRQTEDMTVALLHACGEWGCWEKGLYPPLWNNSNSNDKQSLEQQEHPRHMSEPFLFRDLFMEGSCSHYRDDVEAQVDARRQRQWGMVIKQWDEEARVQRRAGDCDADALLSNSQPRHLPTGMSSVSFSPSAAKGLLPHQHASSSSSSSSPPPPPRIQFAQLYITPYSRRLPAAPPVDLQLELHRIYQAYAQDAAMHRVVQDLKRQQEKTKKREKGEGGGGSGDTGGSTHGTRPEGAIDDGGSGERSTPSSASLLFDGGYGEDAPWVRYLERVHQKLREHQMRRRRLNRALMRQQRLRQRSRVHTQRGRRERGGVWYVNDQEEYDDDDDEEHDDEEEEDDEEQHLAADGRGDREIEKKLSLRDGEDTGKDWAKSVPTQRSSRPSRGVMGDDGDASALPLLSVGVIEAAETNGKAPPSLLPAMSPGSKLAVSLPALGSVDRIEADTRYHHGGTSGKDVKGEDRPHQRRDSIGSVRSVPATPPFAKSSTGSHHNDNNNYVHHASSPLSNTDFAIVKPSSVQPHQRHMSKDEMAEHKKITGVAERKDAEDEDDDHCMRMNEASWEPYMREMTAVVNSVHVLGDSRNRRNHTSSAHAKGEEEGDRPRDRRSRSFSRVSASSAAHRNGVGRAGRIHSHFDHYGGRKGRPSGRYSYWDNYFDDDEFFSGSLTPSSLDSATATRDAFTSELYTTTAARRRRRRRRRRKEQCTQRQREREAVEQRQRKRKQREAERQQEHALKQQRQRELDDERRREKLRAISLGSIALSPDAPHSEPLPGAEEDEEEMSIVHLVQAAASRTGGVTDRTGTTLRNSGNGAARSVTHNSSHKLVGGAAGQTNTIEKEEKPKKKKKKGLFARMFSCTRDP